MSRAAYVDSSCVVAVLLGERESVAVGLELDAWLLSSTNLLGAEVRAAAMREGLAFDWPVVLGDIRWLLPDRPLDREMAAVLVRGYLRGADLWHVAAALYLQDKIADLSFLTLDHRQSEIARAAGLPTPLERFLAV